jgi:cytochrome c oxidase subunit II
MAIGIIRIASLIAMFSASVSLSPPYAAAQDNEKKVVHVVAERFSFSPSHITVEPGTVVEIRLTSEDTAHGFRIAGPNGVDVTIPKRGRGEIVVPFEARAPGDYVFECSRMCGAGHSFMRGRIRVKARP